MRGEFGVLEQNTLHLYIVDRNSQSIQCIKGHEILYKFTYILLGPKAKYHVLLENNAPDVTFTTITMKNLKATRIIDLSF